MSSHNSDIGKAKRQKWDLMRYHFDEACLSIMKKDETITIEELQSRLKEKYGFKCWAKTISKLNRKLEAEYGIAPLKVYYELNPEYLSRVGRHHTGTPRAWKKYIQDEKELDAQS